MPLLATQLVAALALAAGRPAARRSSKACARSTILASAGAAICAVDICTPDVRALASFYEECLGMERSERAGCIEMGFAGGATRLKLIEAPAAAFRVGAGFESIALDLPDVGAAVAGVAAAGGTVILPPEQCAVGPSKIPDEPVGTTHATLEALVSDPQGYRFRLIQRAGGASRVAKVVLRVTDLELSRAFYAELLGMSVLRWRSNLMSTPPSTTLTMQIGDPAVLNGAPVLEEAESAPHAPAVLELIYTFDMRKTDAGEGGAGRLTLAAAGVHDIATRAPSALGTVVENAPGGTAALLRDPDGFEVRLVGTHGV